MAVLGLLFVIQLGLSLPAAATKLGAAARLGASAGRALLAQPVLQPDYNVYLHK